MSSTDNLEVWLRGPVPEIPMLLQPVAHALLQAGEEIDKLMTGFPDACLWQRPAGVASVGFHLQHLSGVLDRLFTYARGEALTAEQLKFLESEGQPPHPQCKTQDLVRQFHAQVARALTQLRQTHEDILLQPRGVGRKQIPSTVLGLLFHAAEHTQRHLGQLIVTARICRNA